MLSKRLNPRDFTEFFVLFDQSYNFSLLLQITTLKKPRIKTDKETLPMQYNHSNSLENSSYVQI